MAKPTLRTMALAGLALGGCTQDGVVTGVGAGLSIDVERVMRIEEGNNSVFAAKYVCGETTTNDPLVNAVYRTEISSMNPIDDNVTTGWRVAFVYPGTPPSTSTVERIHGTYRGYFMNCDDIRQALAEDPSGEDIDPDTPLLKGYVMISSEDTRLIVTTVHTTLHKQVHGYQLVDLAVSTDCGVDALTVTVTNEGQGLSPATVTLVNIEDMLPLQLPTPGLDPGQQVELDPAPTAGGASYSFAATVDPANEIDESDEMNNQVAGNCEFG